MDAEEMRAFLASQVHEIEIYKWLESEKAGHDLGEAAVKEWIAKYAKQFRENWKNGM